MQAGVPEAGDIVAGKYRIERVLGAGGMGVVLAAVHVHLHERVAIKILSPEVAVNRDTVTRFLQEAQAACRIKSEHVARVSDVGALESGAPYLVMEYLEGQDLAQLVAEGGRLRVAEAVGFVLQACEAIAEAHVLGIVHRDLKPANLFLTHRFEGTPWIKVLDFGISKLTHSRTGANPALTDSAAVMGSPLYMSPEQLRAARAVDLRADIWALGVIVYELLMGRPPFAGETLPEVSVKIAVDRPESLRAQRRDVPPGLETAVFKCLEKDRERRFQSVAELAAALAPFGADEAQASADRIRRIVDSVRRPRESSEHKRHSIDALSVPLRTSARWRRPGVVGAGAAVVIGIAIGSVRSRAPESDEVTGASGGVERRELRTTATGAAESSVRSLPPTVVPLDTEVVPPPSPSSLPSSPESAAPALASETPKTAVAPVFTAEPKPAAPVSPSVELLARGGSYVLLDGRPLGATPVKLDLPPGEHLAKFVHDGRTTTRVFTIQPGQQLRIEVGPEDFNIENPYRWGSGLEPTPAGTSAASPSTAFDRAAATAALQRAANRARTCARPSGPSGVAVVKVTFVPSGRVENAVLNGAIAGSAVAECVTTLFRALAVPTFAGNPVSMATTVTVM